MCSIGYVTDTVTVRVYQHSYAQQILFGLFLPPADKSCRQIKNNNSVQLPHTAAVRQSCSLLRLHCSVQHSHDISLASATVSVAIMATFVEWTSSCKRLSQSTVTRYNQKCDSHTRDSMMPKARHSNQQLPGHM